MSIERRKVGDILKHISDDIVTTVFVDSSVESIEVRGVCFDSREVEYSTVFIANKGKSSNSHTFLEDVRQKGASCCLVSELQENINIPQIQVRDTRDVGAKISNFLFDFPSKEIPVVGITGTSGKTSTSWILASILKCCGREVDAFGSYTSGALFSFGDVKPNVPILEVNRIVERIYSDIETGKDSVVMEINSYDLALKRVEYSVFTGAIFTNISKDHIDYHGTFEEYLTTKKHLSDLVVNGGFVITNKDDVIFGKDGFFPSNLKVLTFSTKDNLADIYATNICESLKGTSFDIQFKEKKYQANIGLIGAFQVQNCMAAILAAVEMGIGFEKIVKSLSEIPSPPGRYQVLEKKGSIFVVDYAHNENSLQESLTLSRSLTRGKVISVYGGEWDGQNQKRKQMGEIIGSHSDIVIITTNNPKYEPLNEAVRGIEEGVLNTKSKSFVILDRRLAIQKALEICDPGDLVIILGSGHHNTQQIGDEKIPFNDYLVIKELLKNEQ